MSCRAPARVGGKRSTRHQRNQSTPNPDLIAQSEAEDQQLLHRLREVNPSVALQYLEYLILQRGSKVGSCSIVKCRVLNGVHIIGPRYPHGIRHGLH